MVRGIKTALTFNIAVLYTCLQGRSARPHPMESHIPHGDSWPYFHPELDNPASHGHLYAEASSPSSPSSHSSGELDEFQYDNEHQFTGHDFPSTFSGLLAAMGAPNHEWFSQIHQPPVEHWHNAHLSDLPSYPDIPKNDLQKVNLGVENPLVPFVEMNPRPDVKGHHREQVEDHPQEEVGDHPQEEVEDHPQEEVEDHPHPKVNDRPTKEVKDHPQEQVNDLLEIPFGVSSEITIKQFGWLNTLFFPSARKMNILRHDQWALSTSAPWKNLETEPHGPALPTLVNEANKAAGDKNPNVLKNFDDLLAEIDIRNKQFLMAFIPSMEEKRFLTDLRRHPNYDKMNKQHERLLAWFWRQLEPAPHAANEAGPEEYDGTFKSLSPFQEMLFMYLKSNPESAELKSGTWQTQMRKTKKKVHVVNHGGAILTEVALYAMGTFYKSTNSDKWDKLFVSDDHFIKFFLFLKSREHHGSIKRRTGDSARWEKLEVLPWEEVHKFKKDDPTKRIHSKFLTSLQNFGLNTIEDKFVPVPVQTDGVPAPAMEAMVSEPEKIDN
ncbi:hypothetical protein PSTG_00530 [Puccinia striiformis f. sp. tritici PST-78]|uniref:Uncharacterized protein n=1 Tax=Puccinia striiformis f. sp. tritici PST-78 TaxID=1165861 RepID=A0A0L0W567_9BASI|nr:hypothetical protein PSTG_00530 [Puccinia striiformis f. sp. tritici PST-78]